MQQSNQNPEYWIKKLGLSPHPEGGFYKETYRCTDSIPRSALPAGFKGERSVSTSIYYLLQGLQVSRLHRIQSDEIWHHYAGDDLKLISVDPAGS
ncbi:MAG: cupin domain-containing protein, partial [Candidatus Omnitrophica bacterium]|nr:cupin domain-containing protein [Candidatus Omnitrophota bacterium]